MNTTLSPAMDETLRYIYSEVIERYTPEYIKTIEFEYTPWVFSLLGSIVIGLSGIFPLLVIPINAGGSSDFNDRMYLVEIIECISFKNLHISLFQFATIFNSIT